MSSFTFRLSTAVLFVAIASSHSFAQVQTVNAADFGWYRSASASPANNLNYVVGYSSGSLSRNFLIFDSSLFNSGTIVGATLQVFNPSLATSALGNGYSSMQASETVQIHSFEGNVANLSNRVTGASIFGDLGDGALFGSATVTSANNGQWINFVLNSDFLSYVNSVDGLFALGGMLSTYSGGTFFNEYVFGFSNANPVAPRLVLEFAPVPEPSTYGLLGAAGLLGLIAWRRRHAKS